MVGQGEAKLNVAPAQDNAPLFCRPLPAALETRILKQLEPNVLAVCRLVNSRWRDAVDELNSRWCAELRRIGIALPGDCHQSASAVLTRSCHELPKICKTGTNDCWMGCDLCPVVEDTDALDGDFPPLSELQLATADFFSARFRKVKIKVAAFDGASAKYYSWVLRLTGAELDFWSFLDYNDLFDGRNVCEWTALVEIKAHTSTWKSVSPGSGLIDFTEILQMLETLSPDSSGGSDKTLDDGSEHEKGKLLFERINNAISKLFDLSPERLREDEQLETDMPIKPIEPCLFAVVPLNRTQSGRVKPQCFIALENRNRLKSVATHRCQSCSETQLLLLSSHQLHLYCLPCAPDSPYLDAGQVPPILSPVATIEFRPEPQILCPWFHHSTKIFAVMSTGSMKSETAYQRFVIALPRERFCSHVYIELPSPFESSNSRDYDADEDIRTYDRVDRDDRADDRLAAFVIQSGCQTVSIVNRVWIPPTMSLLCSTLRHCEALLVARTDDLIRSHGKLLFLRMDAAANEDNSVPLELFQIRADSTSSLSCVQYNTVSPVFLNNEIKSHVEFDFGSIFWYIFSRNSEVGELELVIYRIGRPQPVAIVSLFGLLPFVGICEDLTHIWCGPRKISTASCRWVESGLDPDKKAIPLLAMFCHKGMLLLFSWFWKKPVRPTIGAARIKRFQIASSRLSG